VTTVDILFSVQAVHGRQLDRALYERNISGPELYALLPGPLRVAANATLR
jgi:hypothetical protein